MTVHRCIVNKLVRILYIWYVWCRSTMASGTFLTTTQHYAFVLPQALAGSPTPAPSKQHADPSATSWQLPDDVAKVLQAALERHAQQEMNGKWQAQAFESYRSASLTRHVVADVDGSAGPGGRGGAGGGGGRGAGIQPVGDGDTPGACTAEEETNRWVWNNWGGVGCIMYGMRLLTVCMCELNTHMWASIQKQAPYAMTHTCSFDKRCACVK